MTPAKSHAAAPDTFYGAQNLTILEGLQAVRKRPGMYIGGTGPDGLHHLIWEVVDNSVDEAMAGFCDRIDVRMHADGSLSVQDNGRGIPTDIHKASGKSGVEVALTVLHAGGKFGEDGSAYVKSGGLHGVGVSVVNALSSLVEVVVERGGQKHRQEFRNGGTPVAPLAAVGKSAKRGTYVRFLPDATIFTETTTFDYERVANRLRQTAFLNSGLTVTLTDARTSAGAEPTTEVFHYREGLREMVTHLNHTKEPIHGEVITIGGSDQGVDVDIALQYNRHYSETLIAFANNVRTGGGGTHVTGFKAALTNVMLKVVEELGTKEQKKVKLEGGDMLEGLTAVVAVRLAAAQFEGQTKDKLNNSEVRGIVQGIVGTQLREFFERQPAVARKIIEKVTAAARVREAARKVREVERKKNLLDVGTLPGKLADCSVENPARNEVYLVEGDSAGGSAKQGRNREFQAILALRGKVLNTERVQLDKILGNEEIKAIIQAIGCGFGSEFDVGKRRYDKIVLMTDADVDGAHIRTLLLTLFFRYFLPLIEDGHIYIAQPPLYSLTKGKQQQYAYSDTERDAWLEKMGRDGVNIQRYKGLGEMNPEQLWSTTMDPEQRVLLRVTIEDAMSANDAFSTLMGEVVEPRRDFIVKHARFVQRLDV